MKRNGLIKVVRGVAEVGKSQMCFIAAFIKGFIKGAAMGLVAFGAFAIVISLIFRKINGIEDEE